MNNVVTVFLPQFEELIAFAEELLKKSGGRDANIPPESAVYLVASAIAAVSRAVGPTDSYTTQLEKSLNAVKPGWDVYKVRPVLGTLRAVRDAIKAGYLVKLEQLANAALFTDFLEMAQYLLREGYKDPAAVIIGSVLEEHLRKLCIKNTIDIETTDAKGNVYPKKADAMNSELSNEGIYNKLDQKSVTGWLDLRNKAAHGKYSEYAQTQVELMLQGVTDFLVRNPS